MGQLNVPLDLSSRLNRRRRELGISAADLARRTDLSRNHVESLLTGKRTPTPTVAEHLIRVLDLDDELADALRSLEGSHYKSAAGARLILTRDDPRATE